MDPQNILAQHPGTHSASTAFGRQTATIDADTYIDRLRADNAAGRCFICELADEQTTPAQTVAYRDEHCVVFFPRWPRLYAYCLLAPRRHTTNVVSDFTEHDYLALQLRIHRLGRVLAEITPTERLYVFSFGSMQGVAHVHWHVAPLPPGIPFREQQFAAVDKLEYLVIAEAELVELAERIGAGMTALAEQDRGRSSGSNMGTEAQKTKR
ncbi:HIT family protein [Nocardia colli]|uniref:HIT family protein n=1 Tax=Nocardia colli TaxID=2545717 RepID=UPI0035D731BD